MLWSKAIMKQSSQSKVLNFLKMLVHYQETRKVRSPKLNKNHLKTNFIKSLQNLAWLSLILTIKQLIWIGISWQGMNIKNEQLKILFFWLSLTQKFMMRSLNKLGWNTRPTDQKQYYLKVLLGQVRQPVQKLSPNKSISHWYTSQLSRSWANSMAKVSRNCPKCGRYAKSWVK